MDRKQLGYSNQLKFNSFPILLGDAYIIGFSVKALFSMFFKLREVLMSNFAPLGKMKVSGFVAVLICLVNVAVKKNPLNCLEDMISGEMKKFGKSSFFI